jgi:putative membrane protein
MSGDGSDGAEPRPTSDELAQRRTDLAEDRTILANERTYAGWMRTAFAAIGVGLGFRALFTEMQPPWLPRAIATLFLLIGIALFVAAERRAAWVVNHLRVHAVETVRVRNMRLVTAAMVLATLVLIVAMWTTRMTTPT